MTETSDRQLIINAVAQGFPPDRWLTEQQFNDRLGMLRLAEKTGVIDRDTFIQGNNFLVEHRDKGGSG